MSLTDGLDMKNVLVMAALIFVFGCGVSGCATQPISYEAATDVPANRLFGYAPGDAKVSVRATRDTGSQGGAIDLLLIVNGQKVAKMATGERVLFRVPAGKNIFQLGECGSMAGCIQLAVRAEAGETVNLRIAPFMISETLPN